jgi:predicted DNA-binding ribbon-helix-helix protein
MKACISLGRSQIRKWTVNGWGDIPQTSVTLEPQFWAILKEMAGDRGVHAMVRGITVAPGENRSSHLRVLCLEYVKARAAKAKAAALQRNQQAPRIPLIFHESSDEKHDT